MPGITRNEIDPSEGHGYPPRATDTAGQSSVFVNNALATVVGAHYPTHCLGPDCHDGSASEGSPDVIIEGNSVHRIGDAINCGDVSGSGSQDVISN